LREYQVLIPFDRWAEAVREIEEALRRTGALPVVTSLKYFEGGVASGVRFDGEGLVLAMDLPADAATSACLEILDGIVAEVGGRLYLAKDSRAFIPLFSKLFPGAERAFREAEASAVTSRIPLPSHA